MEAITPDKLAKKLIEIAPNYRPDSWRIIRNSIALDQQKKGYKHQKIRDVVNPTTANKSDRSQVKAKQKRCTKVTDENAKKLIQHLNNNDDKRMVAAVYIARITGCRPAEMKGIKYEGGNEFLIKGAKKREDRGIDRKIKVPDEVVKKIISAVKLLQNENMKQVQNNIANAAKVVFPKPSERFIRPSLYSFRHQMGSNLKASELDRSEIAYLMGHASTQSVERYGNKRSAKSPVTLRAAASKNEIDAVVKVNHKELVKTTKSNQTEKIFTGEEVEAALIKILTRGMEENTHIPITLKAIKEILGPGNESSIFEHWIKFDSQKPEGSQHDGELGHALELFRKNSIKL